MQPPGADIVVGDVHAHVGNPHVVADGAVVQVRVEDAADFLDARRSLRVTPPLAPSRTGPPKWVWRTRSGSKTFGHLDGPTNPGSYTVVA